MKKTLIVVALAIVLALSFATIATAKYAGYAYNNPVKNADSTSSPNPFPGYLSWSGANAIYNRDNNVTTGQTTAHGGYVSTTVKCAVCHSAHRATSPAASTAGVSFASTQLTSASGCVNCHTAWGAGGSNKKIEWANLLTGQSAGPHTSGSFPAGCTSNCHTGGVHGNSVSAYNGMNAFMLGSDKDAAITTAFKNGNTSTNITYVANGKPGQGGNGPDWFQRGNTSVPSTGLPPSNVGATSFAAAKGTATGYTCGQSGCHVSSQFAVNTWQFSEMRASDPASDPSDPASLDMPMTGHGVGTNQEDAYDPSCGPCHPGALSGGYRYVAQTSANQKSLAYGCDQCHDMVGKLTNTTAWPHGNRNIDVLEWDSAGAVKTTTIARGNLWMYKADISTVNPLLVPDADGNISEYDYRAQANLQTDKSWTVINNATSWTAAGPGSINDGVCLKCHVPVDSASITMRGGSSLGIAPATDRHGNYVDVNGDWHSEYGDYSGFIFLHK